MAIVRRLLEPLAIHPTKGKKCALGHDGAMFAMIRRHAEIKLDRPIVLIGMMGAGKSTIGRRLAHRFGVPFYDADKEIEKAANCSIEEIFERFGEQHFRDGERRVIGRLLALGPQVLATGGGAFMDPETRTLVNGAALSVWLRADLDLLWRRVSRRGNRPLLKTADPKATLKSLIDLRYPVYAKADLIAECHDVPKDETVEQIHTMISARLDDSGTVQETDR